MGGGQQPISGVYKYLYEKLALSWLVCLHITQHQHVISVREVPNRVGPQVEKSPNLHITADSTGSIHKNTRGKKFDPQKVCLGWGNLS